MGEGGRGIHVGNSHDYYRLDDCLNFSFNMWDLQIYSRVTKL